MDSFLDFLDGLNPVATDTTQWGESRLAMASYLDRTLPPDELITSVRAVLLRGQCIAVMHNAAGSHPVPGGRREAREGLLDTLRREVLEEAGCTIDEPIRLGFIHFRHLTPPPAGYRYPYPDFCQIVFAARARKVRDAVDPEDWEEGVDFVPFDRVDRVELETVHRPFVDAAIECLGPEPPGRRIP